MGMYISSKALHTNNNLYTMISIDYVTKIKANSTQYGVDFLIIYVYQIILWGYFGRSHGFWTLLVLNRASRGDDFIYCGIASATFCTWRWGTLFQMSRTIPKF